MSEDISDIEECKMPAWAIAYRDKMFRHQQGDFSFPGLQFSRGELLILISFCYNVLTNITNEFPFAEMQPQKRRKKKAKNDMQSRLCILD
jgi:hypothetical protein